MRVQPEIGVKTKKVGGGRQLRDVARKLDFEVELKQKVKLHELLFGGTFRSLQTRFAFQL